MSSCGGRRAERDAGREQALEQRAHADDLVAERQGADAAEEQALLHVATQCGLRDGLPGWGQFCIDTQLAAALRGDLKKGLFFRGVGALPFGDQIRSVRELMQRLLTPTASVAGA